MEQREGRRVSLPCHTVAQDINGRASLLMLISSGPGLQPLLKCEGLLSGVLQLARVVINSPALTPAGLVPPGSLDGGVESALHSPQTDPVWQPTARTFAWPSVVTEPCCFRATDAHVALGGNTGQDPTRVPGGITGYSHQALNHYLPVSSSVLFIVPASFFFSVCPISIALTCSS